MWLVMNAMSNNDRPSGFDDAFEIRTSTSNIYNELFKGGGGALNTPISTGVLYHLIFTWDYDGSDVVNKIYKDGVLAAGPSTYGGTDPGTGTFKIGASRATATGFVSAEMQDYRFYNRALADADAETLYAARGTDVVLDGLLYWWLMNQGAPGTVVSGAGVVIDEMGNLNCSVGGGTPDWIVSDLAEIRRIA
jgi:hypothetical protein